eukprot:TRINITY_DN123035_c0_g1_i1.p1 TRINITY_DN123035_c0_g1~~TRINITY_DN123035_c0_g1_i1.p1  ORF type:complete len:467 (+),score=110.15 TRINITY_DN123035_c0_g1_i1:252-1652(+)
MGTQAMPEGLDMSRAAPGLSNAAPLSTNMIQSAQVRSSSIAATLPSQLLPREMQMQACRPPAPRHAPAVPSFGRTLAAMEPPCQVQTAAGKMRRQSPLLWVPPRDSPMGLMPRQRKRPAAGAHVRRMTAVPIAASAACTMERKKPAVSKRSLMQLNRQLKALPPEARKKKIVGLDLATRRALLRHMEDARRAAAERSQNALCGSGKRRRVPSRGGGRQDGAGQKSRPPQAAEHAKAVKRPRRRVFAPPLAAGSCLRKISRSVGLQKSRQGLYRAKCCIGQVSFYSEYVSETAVKASRDFLARLRSRVYENWQAARADSAARSCCKFLRMPDAIQEGGLREPFLAALRQLEGDEVGSSSGIEIRAYVNLHVAKWLGSTHVTSPVLPIEETLAWREELLRAQPLGWPAFRQVWIKLLQHPAHPPRLRRSLAEAEAYADAAHVRVKNKAATRHGKGQAASGRQLAADGW